MPSVHYGEFNGKELFFRRTIVLATKTSKKSMNMAEIRKKAKKLGITPGKKKKAELIHAIQIVEGCVPCFGMSNGQCAQTECCFFQDCLKTKL